MLQVIGNMSSCTGAGNLGGVPVLQEQTLGEEGRRWAADSWSRLEGQRDVRELTLQHKSEVGTKLGYAVIGSPNRVLDAYLLCNLSNSSELLGMVM